MNMPERLPCPKCGTVETEYTADYRNTSCVICKCDWWKWQGGLGNIRSPYGHILRWNKKVEEFRSRAHVADMTLRVKESSRTTQHRIMENTDGDAECPGCRRVPDYFVDDSPLCLECFIDIKRAEAKGKSNG